MLSYVFLTSAPFMEFKKKKLPEKIRCRFNKNNVEISIVMYIFQGSTHIIMRCFLLRV